MSKVNSFLNEIEADELIAQGKYEEARKLLESSLKNNNYIDRQSVYHNLAVCYMASRDFVKAKEYLEKAVSLSRDDMNDLYNLAFCHYSLEEHEKAVVLFEEIKKKEGMKTDVAFNLGMSYMALSKTEKAMDNFRNLLETGAASSLIYDAGLALIGAQRPELAMELFLQTLRNSPNDIDATFGLGLAYSRQGDDRKAIECLKRVIEWDGKKYQSAYVSLAMSYFQIGDLSACMEQLDKVIQINPEFAEAWYYLGFVLENSGQTERSISSYEKAGAIDHTMIEVWQRLGQLYLKCDRLEEARISFKKVLKISNDINYAYRIAMILIAQKNYNKALDYLLLCRELPGMADYDLNELYENLSVCYYYAGDYVKALDYGERAVRDTTGVFPLFILGSASMKLGEMKKSRKYLLKGLEQDPRDVSILYGLGILEAGSENYPLADDYLNKALIIQRNPDIIYALALTKMKMGDPEAAAGLFHEYQQAHGSDADVLYKLGLIFIELKKFDLAKGAFRETLKLKPENRKARDYLLSLK